MIEYNKRILKDSIRFYGENNQIVVATEEMAELTQVLTKYLRSAIVDREHLVEEFADVTYMLEQVKDIFNLEDREINKAIWEKQNRQAYRIIQDEKKKLVKEKNEYKTDAS